MAKSNDTASQLDGDHPWAKFDQIVENVSDSIAVVDREWRFVYLNTHARNQIGADRDLIGQVIWDVLPDISEHAFGQMYRQSMADRIAREEEAYYAPLRGWFAVRVVPVPIGLAGFFRTTTSERQRDSALKSSEARLQSMFDTLSMGVLIYDRNGTIIDANPAAEGILGVRRDCLCGVTSESPNLSAVDANGQLLAGDAYPAMVALRAGRVIRNFVMGIHNPQRGERRWLSVDACPITEAGADEPSQVYAIFSDVTERQNAENDLRLSRLFMSTAQRVTSVGSAAIDFRTEKWNWSDETYRIYGVDPAEFVPGFDSLAALVHPEDRDRLLSAPDLARQGMTPPPIEYRIIRPDGVERTIRREAALIHGDAGDVLGIVGTVQDVTDIRAQEREKQLLQAQLIHAQRLDALGTLAGGIAHDLNNTLVPVVALSEIIANSLAPDDERRTLVELIRTAGERGRDLVGQVLAFTRRDTPNRQRMDLAEFLRTSMGLLRASIPASIEIDEDFESVRPVLADPAQLHQVLVNLATNAAHAIGDKPGRIGISLTEGVPEQVDRIAANTDSFAVISIADSGCGMDEHVQARIFEPFYTTKRIGVGTGLGLAVVHGIVTAHGGSVVVDSKPGAGSRFDVYLPICL